MATAKKTELVEIRPIEMETAVVRIVGDSPLIVHAWSAKAKREILEKEIGVPIRIVSLGPDRDTIIEYQKPV